MILDPMARDWHEQLRRQPLPHHEASRNCSNWASTTNKRSRSSAAATRPAGEQQGSVELSGDRNVLQTFNGDVSEFVDLVEVYLPKEQLIVTLPFGPGFGDDDVLRVVEYEGPERGPFHMLGFAYVPDNVLPVPPASIWYYLQVMGNRIARKIGRQAERMKTVLAYDGIAP
jgi:hypothetical protein